MDDYANSTQSCVCVFTCVHVSMCVLLVQEVQCVCQYESEHTLPPLCGTLAAVQLTASSGEHNSHMVL